MAVYGWEMYDINGGVVSNDSSLNCFYLDHYISPGNGSYSKTFPDYAYSDIQVMCGGAVVPAFAAAPPTSSSVSYGVGGVPTVTISDSGSNGGTYWITCSRIDPRSVLGSGYGINLYDALNGVAFPAGSSPFVFIGKGQFPNTYPEDGWWLGEPASGGGIGIAYIETDTSIPPLCFWRASEDIGGETMHNLPPFGASVKRSTVTPKSKNYRWSLGVTLEGRPDEPIGTFVNALVPYCFQPSVNETTTGYGIGMYTDSDTVGIALTDKPMLQINKHIIQSSDLVTSGNHLLVYTGSNPAMLPLYSYRKYVPPGSAASKFYVVYWYPSKFSGYVYGQHMMGITRKGYATDFSNADRNANWYKNVVFSNGMATHIIDVNNYN